MRVVPMRCVLIVCSLLARASAQEAVPAAPAVPAVEWSTDLAATLAKAKAAKQPTLVFFTASWCVPCKQLKANVCSTKEFAAAFAGYAFAMIDIDRDKASAREWQVGPIPDLRFVAADGEELGGFVGERDLTSLLGLRDAASASALRTIELRAKVANTPNDPATLLLLAEHLLQRPNRRPGIDAMTKVIAADADNKAGLAARAQWHIVGTCFHPIGRASAQDLADSVARQAAMATWTSGDAPVYVDAVNAWLQWSEAMRQWSERREREKNRDLPLAVPADAPLRQTLARLSVQAATRSPAADAAADGVLIDGMLHYYSGDYATGIERLSAFTRDFPAHRWHDEGLRFLAINQRLLRERGAKK